MYAPSPGQKPKQQRTPEREAARALVARLTGQYEAIRAADDLSTPGKHRQMAKLHLAAESKLSELRQAEETRLRSERDTAENTLYGRTKTLTGADAISMRDAHDRAARLKTPDAASKLLARAQSTQDNMLAAAIAEHAASRGWRSVMTNYVGTDEHKTNALTKLAAIDAATADRADQLNRNVLYRPSPPPELTRYGPGQLQSLADAAGQPDNGGTAT